MKKITQNVVMLLVACFMLFANSANSQIVWNGGSSFNWMTATNWTGGSVPGSNAWAQFGANGTALSNLITMNSNNNNGTSNQAVGAIEMTSARGVQLNIGASTGPGTLTLNGATVNGISNVVLYNSNSSLLGFPTSSPSLQISIPGTTNRIFKTAGGSSSTTSGSVISMTDTITSSAPFTFLGGGTWDGTTGNAGGFWKLTAGGQNFSGGVTVGNSDGTESGVLELGAVNTMLNTTGNNIVVNPNSELFLNAANGTYKTNNINLTLKGNGNPVSTTSPGGALVTKLNANYTWLGNINLATDATITPIGSTTLTDSGNIVGPGALIKYGTSSIGKIILAGTGNTWTGGTQVGVGSITVAAGSSISTGPLSFTGLASFNNYVTFNNTAQTISSLSSSFVPTSGAQSQTLSLSSGHTLTLDQSTNTVFGSNGTVSTQTSVISGAGSLIKKGTGVLTLTSNGNALTGGLTITEGEIRFNPRLTTTVNMSSCPVTLNGGKLTTTGDTTTVTISFGVLTVSANSTIDLGTVTTHSIKFAASGAANWTDSLNITNWLGTYGAAGTKGRLYIGTSSSGLTSGQLAKIKFTYAGGRTIPAIILATGEIVPKSTLSFTGSSTLSICQDAGATAINSLLQINDDFSSLTGNYALTSGPTHGSLTYGTTVTTVAGTDVSPTGWSYTPTAGYNGYDNFTVEISDGSGGFARKTINITINAATLSSNNISICPSALPYNWNGLTFTTAGTQTTHLTNAAGCDSVATLNLTIDQPTTSTTTQITNGSYNWNGNTYTTGGTYTWTGTNAAGCDSVATLNLTIVTPQVSNNSVIEGQTATFTVSVAGNPAPGIQWQVSTDGGLTWNDISGANSASLSITTNPSLNGNQYHAVVTNSAGSVTTNAATLTVTPSCTPTSSTESVSVCDSYVWHGTTYTTSGAKTWTGTNAAGCDSIVILNLTINNATSSTETASACGSYVWHGTTYTSSNNTATWTGTNAAGCDSVVTLNLTINNATSSTETVSACGSYVWHGTTYTSSNNTATWTGTNAAGCDSIVTLNLTINNATSSTETVSACGSYVWHGTTYTSSNNTATWTGTNAAGCDSVVTLNLTINNSTSSTQTASACGSYVWHGTTYTSSNNTATWTGTNAAGCDSLVTLNLTIRNATSSTQTASACGSYTWHGTTYTSSNNTATWTGTNAAGCDSVVTLNLTIKNATSSTQTASACGSYLWHGTTYTSSNNTATWTGTNAAGCDSVVTLNLTIRNATSSTETVSACGSYVWHGTTYTTSGAKIWTGTNAAGCDSVVTLNLTIRNPSTASVSLTVNGSYNWHGQNYTTSGTYSWIGANAAGCDSMVTLNLTVNPILVSNISNVCSYIGSTETIIYTADVSGASSYAWTLPPNVQLVSGQGSQSITIRILNGFATQSNKQIRVTPAGGSVQVFYLLAQAPVTPAPITASSTNICNSLGNNVPITFSIPRVYEAPSNGVTTTSYIWTAQSATTNINHPNGTGINDTIVTITFASNFTSSNVSVQSLNACGVSNSRTYQITLATPLQPGLISGPTNSCEYIGESGQTATYSVPEVINVASYSWTLPQGASNVTGQGTRSISFRYPAGFSSGTISVTATNGCGTSTSRSLSVSRLTPATPGNIDVINISSCPNRVYTYSVASLPANATSLLWTVPAGATLVSGQSSTSITVSYPSSVIDGLVIVKAVANCGISSTRTSVVKLAPCPAAPQTLYTKGTGIALPLSMDVKVFPNPTTSSFNLKAITLDNGMAKARLLDAQGRMIRTIMINPGETIILGSELKSGVYFLEVSEGEESKTIRVVKY